MDNETQPESASQRAVRHQREDVRDSLLLQAPMRYAPEAPTVLLRVRNLSAGGMMADCTVPVEPGQAVEVDIRNIGAVSGRIAWARKGQIGIAFDNRIQPRLARSPVGTHAADSRLLRQPNERQRRPGLRIE